MARALQRVQCKRNPQKSRVQLRNSMAPIERDHRNVIIERPKQYCNGKNQQCFDQLVEDNIRCIDDSMVRPSLGWKAKTHRGKLILENRNPKLVEDTKKALFVRGNKTSDTCLKALKDFAILKKPDSSLYLRKNDIRPMEDDSILEKFLTKSEAPLFMFASHNKKRPHNIVIGRTYDYHMLDMVELGLEEYKGLSDFKGSKIPLSTKPMLVFSGETFQQDPEFKRLKSLLLGDMELIGTKWKKMPFLFYQQNINYPEAGTEVEKIRLAGLEHAISFTAVDRKVVMKSYKVLLKKSGTKVPRIELEEIGPSALFSIRRTKLASDDLFKQALKQPKQLKMKKKKNVKKDKLGTKFGRVHMGKLDLGNFQTRKMKGLKKRKLATGSKSPRKLKKVA
ncbi:Ribosome production factor 2 [Nymphon striatum]|nr:Ribosome production factor 2 [Nymphon striatum]